MILLIYSFFSRLLNSFTPQVIKDVLDPENYSIRTFVKEMSETVGKSDYILDAGAGSCPYKKFFSHAHYEATDFEEIFDKSSLRKHDFLCNLEHIPKENNTYDAVLNTQVLEHVPDPLAVLKEFHRVLKPQGKLFLTAPQGWGIHGAPYHFFNFTNYGLQNLFEKAGFTVVFIRPRGGFFWYLAKRLHTFPTYIFKQYVLAKRGDRFKIKISLFAFFLFPFYVISLPFFSLCFPTILFFLDWLDRWKDYTLGYACFCVKK